MLEDLFFLALALFEVIWTVCLLMINGVRLEAQIEKSYREQLEAQTAQAWLKTVIARSLNEIYVFDARTLRFTFVNDGACRNLGYTMDELLALTPIDIKPRITAAAFAELVQPLREGTIPVLTFETVHQRKDGSEYPVEAHVQLVDSGGGEVFLAVINDITERSRTEARLRLNEARLEGLIGISEHGERTEAQLLDFALHKALALTGSAVGYVYLYHEGSRQFVLSSWSRGVMEECAILEKQTVYDLERTGVWGEAVRQRQPILVNDFAADHPLKKGYPAGHVALQRFLTVPVFSGFEIVAVVGVANKEDDYDASDIVQLSLLMDSVWRIVERARAEAALDAQNALLTTVINSPGDMIIFSVDRDYRYTAFNEKHRRTMRLVWTAEIEIGLSILEMMTDRVLREAALHASESRFRTLFESMDEGVALHELLCDGSGTATDYRLVDVNAAFARHTGIAPALARGALASVLYHGPPPAEQAFPDLRRLARGRPVRNGFYRHHRAQTPGGGAAAQEFGAGALHLHGLPRSQEPAGDGQDFSWLSAAGYLPVRDGTHHPGFAVHAHRHRQDGGAARRSARDVARRPGRGRAGDGEFRGAGRRGSGPGRRPHRGARISFTLPGALLPPAAA